MREINCDVIRDLLPGYVDDLASEATRALVEEHVETCESCRAALSAMRAPEPVSEPEKKEIDFLKTTRKKGRRAVLWSIVGVLALCFAAMLLRMFAIGSPGEPSWLYSEAEVEDTHLALRCSPNDSAGAVANLKFSDADGVVTVTARRVLTSPLHRGSAEAAYDASAPIRRVIVNDRVVWDEGMDVSPYTSKLYSLRNPYVGDASKDMALLHALLVPDYTMVELQTETEPYGMTVRLPERTPGEIAALHPQLRSAGCALIALIENLGEVEFTFGDFNASPVRVTEAEATQMLREIVVGTTTDGGELPAGPTVKDCFDSPAMLETLLRGLRLNGPVYLSGDTAYERRITIVNGTDLEIADMSLEVLSDGEIRSSETGMYADESAITRGNTLDFTVPTLGGQTECRLTFNTMDGQTYTVEDVDVTAETLTLRDDGSGACTLEP